MKRSLRTLLFLLLAVSVLTVSAFADMGPKSQLIVRVKNAPEELYYLDLLAEGDPKNLHDYSSEERAKLDPALLEALISAIPEGWHGCVSQGVKGAPIFGNLTAAEEGIHPFSYFGVPWTYRILMVSKSGDIYLSDVQERTVLQSSVTVDWEKQTISAPPTWIGYVLQFSATFFPTLILEGLLLILFGLAKRRRNWIPFLLVNLLTQGALDVFTTPIGMKKNRPATMLSVLCREEEKEKFVKLIFRHTTTLGVREQSCHRYTLERRTETVQTAAGPVRKKISSGYGVRRKKYEYADLAKLAEARQLSLAEVLEELE